MSDQQNGALELLSNLSTNDIDDNASEIKEILCDIQSELDEMKLNINGISILAHDTKRELKLLTSTSFQTKQLTESVRTNLDGLRDELKEILSILKENK